MARKFGPLIQIEVDAAARIAPGALLGDDARDRLRRVAQLHLRDGDAVAAPAPRSPTQAMKALVRSSPPQAFQ